MRRCKTHALYRSKLWQQDHCQHPQNANPDGSTLEGIAQRIGRPFGGGGAEGQRQIVKDLGVSHTTVNACVKEDLKCRSYWCQTTQILTEKSKNLRLIKSVRPPPPLTWTRWTTSFGHTYRTSPTWSPTTPKPVWSPPSAEYSPSSCRRLWKRCAPRSGSVSRRWLRLKAATLNRCQLYYIIKSSELISSIKVLK